MSTNDKYMNHFAAAYAEVAIDILNAISRGSISNNGEFMKAAEEVSF